VIASSSPGGSVWGSEKGIDLWGRQKAHDATLKAFGGNSQHVLDYLRMLWMTKNCVAEQ
jgi:hypothetical protein